MMGASRRRSARSYGGTQRGKGQSCIDAPTNRIANHTARPGVEDRREIHEPPCDRDVGDVGHPELIRARRRDALSQVWEYRPIMIAVGGDHVAPPRLHGKAVFLHKPHDLLVVDDNPVLTQLGRYASVAVPRELGTDFGDLRYELPLLDWLTLELVVVGRACE